MVLSRLCGVRRPLADNQEAAMQTTGHSIRGVQDVISYIDARQGISGRAGTIWWLALGGLFLDAFSNSALSVGLGRSEEHTSELQSQSNLVCRLLLEKKKNTRR